MNIKLFSNIKLWVPLHEMHTFPLSNYEFGVLN